MQQPSAIKKRKTRSDKIIIEEPILRQIETMSGYGLSMEKICAIIGINKETLRLKMKDDPQIALAIERGKAVAGLQVVQAAHDMAKSKKDATMTKFWLSCKEGWKEAKAVVEVADVTEQVSEEKLIQLLNNIAKNPIKE